MQKEFKKRKFAVFGVGMWIYRVEYDATCISYQFAPVMDEVKNWQYFMEVEVLCNKINEHTFELPDGKRFNYRNGCYLNHPWIGKIEIER